MEQTTRAQLLAGGSTKAPNPVQRTLTFKGDTGGFKVYNNETKEKTEAPAEGLTFAWLAETSSVTGWNAGDSGFFSSNEVLNTGTQELNVYSANKPFTKGIYKDIKDELVAAGGEYCKNVYGLTPQGTIIKLELTGSQVYAWTQFKDSKEGDIKAKDAILTNAITLAANEAKQKGGVNYKVPTFTIGSVADFDIDSAFSSVFEYINSRIKTTNATSIDVLDSSDMPDLNANTAPSPAQAQLDASNAAMATLSKVDLPF